MKKNIFTILALTVLATSCSVLDTAPTDEIATGNMWTTPELCLEGIDGLLYRFKRAPERYDSDDLYFKAEGILGLNRAGIEGIGFTSDYFANGSPMAYLSDATKRANTNQIECEWRIMYATIHSCNTAIAQLRKDVVGERLYHQYICEAKCIRAYCYSRLNMIYGGVPLYLEEVSDDLCTKGQSKWEDVWDAVIKDCSECIEDEYFQNNNLSGAIRPYRPSRAMAYALRGMAAMWMASDKGKFIDPTAEALPAAQIQSWYESAAADFAKVKECGYSVWNEGEWRDLFTEKYEHNCEMIFALEFDPTSGFEGNWPFQIGTRSAFNGWNQIKPSVDFVDSFQNSDGSDFAWTQVFSDWDDLSDCEKEVYFLRDGLNSSSDSKLKTARTAAIERIGQTIYNSKYLNSGNEARLNRAYDNRDPRLLQAVIVPNHKYIIDNENTAQPIPMYLRWPLSSTAISSGTTENADIKPDVVTSFYYYYYKCLPTDGSCEGRSEDGTDWPLIRYTQIQLMWAEALTQLGQVKQACDLVNEIRHDRAGMPALNTTSKDEALRIIRYETRVELCGEGLNYFDEIRWNTYQESKFQGKFVHYGANLWGERGYEYDWYYVEEMWPWSAPLKEIQMNANLKKRDGWSY